MSLLEGVQSSRSFPPPRQGKKHGNSSSYYGCTKWEICDKQNSRIYLNDMYSECQIQRNIKNRIQEFSKLFMYRTYRRTIAQQLVCLFDDCGEYFLLSLYRYISIRLFIPSVAFNIPFKIALCSRGKGGTINFTFCIYKIHF